MAVRSPQNNPFVPGSDKVPAVWAGRTRELADWDTVVRPRRVVGDYVAGRLLLGPPGIGKSVLANRIAREAQHAGDYVAPAVRVPYGADVLALVAEAVTELIDRRDLGAKLARPVVAVLERVRGLAGVRLGAPAASPNSHRDLYTLLVAVSRLAAHDRRVVVLRIDEVQNARDADQLSQLLVALADALGASWPVTDAAGTEHERSLPLVIYLTGLPDFLAVTERAGATFGRRFQRFDLEPLIDDDIRFALAPFRSDGHVVATQDGLAPVFIDDEAVDLIISSCLGDPYLFQLVGQAAWHAGTSQRITADDVLRGWAQSAPTARTHVERFLDQVPDRERQLLEVCAAVPSEERMSARVASGMGRKAGQEIASALQRLDTTRGILRRGQPITFRMRTVEALLDSDWPEDIDSPR